MVSGWFDFGFVAFTLYWLGLGCKLFDYLLCSVLYTYDLLDFWAIG